MVKRDRNYRFEMPYQVDAPVLTDPAAGIDRVKMLGQQDRRVVSLTLLDTTDERLSAAGVLLAHEVAGDSGQWLFRAPEWQPWLPQERVDPLDEGDELPEDIAELLRPFRRRAAIGPVAGVTMERAVYSLLDADGLELGRVLDDRVTVRRGGLAVARHREVTFEPGEAMTSLQRSLIIDRLNLAGGVRVNEFPDTTQRLTWLTHPVVVAPTPPNPAELSPEDYLEWFFTERFQSLLRADLQVRTGQVAGTALLVDELRELSELVWGLDSIVDPVWAGELQWHVTRVSEQPVRNRIGELGEAYVDALDVLASAARAPRLRTELSGSDSQGSARELLRRDACRQLAAVIDAMNALTRHSPDAQWRRALASAEQLARVLQAGEGVLGKVKNRKDRVVKLLSSLGPTVGRLDEPDPEAIAAMDPVQAYRVGLEYQRARDEVSAPRARVLAGWPSLRAKLLAEWPELAKADDGGVGLLSGGAAGRAAVGTGKGPKGGRG